MKPRTAIAAIALAVGTIAAPITASAASPTAPHTAGCPLPVFGPGADYHPRIDPTRFSANVNNPWFPLPPGTTYVYSGRKDGKHAIDIFAPSRRTRVIDGVRTRVVLDRLLLDGRLEERTSDYYAQDDCGNVWYFGEDTAELDRNGHVVSREGSFHAGVQGAEPGVFMQARPQLGRKFRQEWSPGNAEDQYSAVSLHARISVPYGTYVNALRTRETTALEPNVVDNKVYAYGIGEVVEKAVKGPVETLVLVDVVR